MRKLSLVAKDIRETD